MTNKQDLSLLFEKYVKDNFNLDSTHSSRHFYHLCSKGTKRDVLFHNEKEFVMGMNLVAVCTYSCHVDVLAFCLMPNHFHFILSAKEKEVHLFKHKISKLYSMRRLAFTPEREIESLSWDVLLIHEMSYLQHSIAYVVMNPNNAFFLNSPMDYPWSSMSLYFRSNSFHKSQVQFRKKIKDLLISEYRHDLGTHTMMPKSWSITEDGYVWPGNYVKWQLVEYLYHSVRFFMICLINKKDNQLIKEILSDE